MADWFLNLPVSWMALIVFAATFLIAGGAYLVVTRLAETEWARAFKAVSPGLLPVLGVLFALLVGFIAVDVWNTFDKARPPFPPRPARCVLLFCSPAIFPMNRGRVLMRWSIAT